MFGQRYFGGRHFGPRYWGKAGGPPPPSVAGRATLDTRAAPAGSFWTVGRARAALTTGAADLAALATRPEEDGMPFLQGKLLVSPATFVDLASGEAADPTTVVFRLRAPSGAETAHRYGVAAADVVARTGVGAYELRWQATQAGWWVVRVEGTGAVVDSQEQRVLVKASELRTAGEPV